MNNKIYEVYYYEGMTKYPYAFFSTREKAHAFMDTVMEPYRLKDSVSEDKSKALGIDKRCMYEWSGSPLHVREWDLDRWAGMLTNEPIDKV